MKRNFLFVFLILVVFLGGCSKPIALTHFNKDELFSKALQHTHKNDIVENTTIVIEASTIFSGLLFK